MITGGRDGFIVLYDRESKVESHIQLHSDWTNDMVWFNDTTVISCSSDLSVKWWDYSTNEHGLVGYHEDYVKTIAKSHENVVTGGLDKMVNIWDVKNRTKLASIQNVHGEMGSIYSMDSYDHLVTFGDNRGVLSFLDTRSNQVVKTLEGHNGTVKNLIMTSKGCLSGSADNTVKQWDLRQWEQVKSYDYDGSIWSLYSDDYDFQTFYAGTLQGKLFQTSQDITTLIGKEEKGILSISKFQDELWTSNMGDSSLKNWSVLSQSKTGDAGLIKSRMLNNRRYVVTLSTDNEVVLWDIVKCVQLKAFGTKRLFEEVINEYQTNEILPTWCRVMIKAGRLFVMITESSYTDTELYGDYLNDYDIEVKDDIRYPIGKMMIASIFKKLTDYEMDKDQELRDQRIKDIKSSSKLHLLTKFSSQASQSSSQLTPVDEKTNFYNDSEAPPQSAPAQLDTEKDTGSSFRRLKIFSKKSLRASVSASDDEPPTEQTVAEQPNSQPGSQPSSLMSSKSTDHDSFNTVLAEVKSFYDSTTHLNSLYSSQLIPPSQDECPLLALPKDLHIIVHERISNSSAEVSIYSDDLNNLDYEMLEFVLPRWIGLFTLKNKSIVKDLPKVGFIIQQDQKEHDLPLLSHGTGRLNAYSMLRMKRILTFITDRFEKQTQEMKDGVPVEEWLEVLCHGDVLDINMTLATVRSFVWKQSGDVVLTFQRKSVKDDKLIL
jgi:hypothetical protein